MTRHGCICQFGIEILSAVAGYSDSGGSITRITVTVLPYELLPLRWSEMCPSLHIRLTSLLYFQLLSCPLRVPLDGALATLSPGSPWRLFLLSFYLIAFSSFRGPHNLVKPRTRNNGKLGKAGDKRAHSTRPTRSGVKLSAKGIGQTCSKSP
jgi:hypothetical protein